MEPIIIPNPSKNAYRGTTCVMEHLPVEIQDSRTGFLRFRSANEKRGRSTDLPLGPVDFGRNPTLLSPLALSLGRLLQSLVNSICKAEATLQVCPCLAPIELSAFYLNIARRFCE